MMRITGSIVLIIFSVIARAQGGWNWTILPNMPMHTSNNAVTSAVVNDTTYVYSFFGIGSNKDSTAIHSKAFRYNTISQLWDTIPDIPDAMGGLVAASASTIKNKIYLIGGYHVFGNQSEVSSKQVYIYDPATNSYTQGVDIPVEIDDHVYFEYKDSLIYILTGWTSTIGGGNNTNAVQVYDAVNDQWYAANDMPNTSTYKVFGASGTIVNDTIYFAGGARYGTNFPLVQTLRKGIIDVNNPLSITWSTDTVINGFKPYRSACLNVENKVFWVGGSSTSYNYDGIAYNGSGGVNPNDFVTELNADTKKWAQYNAALHGVMDMRGIAKLDEHQFIICGGMSENQFVTDSVFLISYDTTFVSLTDSVDSVEDTTFINSKLPFVVIEKNGYIYHVKNKGVAEIRLFDLFGRIIKSTAGSQLDILGEKGVFLLDVTFDDGYVYRRRVFIN